MSSSRSMPPYFLSKLYAKTSAASRERASRLGIDLPIVFTLVSSYQPASVSFWLCLEPEANAIPADKLPVTPCFIALPKRDACVRVRSLLRFR
jgi:hypothetical protein